MPQPQLEPMVRPSARLAVQRPQLAPCVKGWPWVFAPEPQLLALADRDVQPWVFPSQPQQHELLALVWAWLPVVDCAALQVHQLKKVALVAAERRPVRVVPKKDVLQRQE